MRSSSRIWRRSRAALAALSMMALCACSTTPAPVTVGCSLPEPAARLMAAPAPLPDIADKSHVALVRDNAMLADAATRRGAQVVALQGHIKDVREFKARCAS